LPYHVTYLKLTSMKVMTRISVSVRGHAQHQLEGARLLAQVHEDRHHQAGLAERDGDRAGDRQRAQVQAGGRHGQAGQATSASQTSTSVPRRAGPPARVTTGLAVRAHAASRIR